ncbi:MAG: sulfurtransferase TusA family protein [Myxococcaceae bacterium]
MSHGIPAHRVDARGKACPLPIIDLARAMACVAPGDHVELWADDPAASKDVFAYCDATGHRLVHLVRHATHLCAHIAKCAPVDSASPGDENGNEQSAASLGRQDTRSR